MQTISQPAISADKIASISMSDMRKSSLAAGFFYLLSFVSIPTLALYAPVHDANYMLSNGTDTSLFTGVILEIIVALACIGTGVALYPVLKKQQEAVALGFVGTRILEAGTIFVGVAFLLSAVPFDQAGARSNAIVTSQAFVAMYDRIFLVGQSFIPAINGILLGYLLYRSRLVPRILPIIGFAGAALLIAGDLAVLFGYVGQREPSTGLFAIPIAIWEFSLGIYLVVKGFRPSEITSGK